jgi:mannose-6-phosphate isomerase-like protein (cupin superfamily)
MNHITEFMQSGLLELYIMGSASPEEAEEVEQMAAAHPEIRQELEAISQTMEDYAQAHAVKPKATLKPLILATINYLERLRNGEPAVTPPTLTPISTIADFAPWLNRPDMVLPADAEAIHAKIIGANPEATTAIVWLTGIAENEIHHDEYERFLIIEGSCAITAGEEVHHLAAGDYYAVPLHTRHMVKVTSAFPCKVILQRLAA